VAVASSVRLRERLRRSVFGFVAPAIVHETNNVLTVLAGVRQLLRTQATLPERAGSMLDQQLERMDDLVGRVRRLGADEPEAGEGRRGLAEVLGSIRGIVEVVGKGRGLAIESSAAEGQAAVDPEALALITLGAILPALPPRGAGGSVRLRLSASGGGSSESIAAELSPADSGIDETETSSARALARECGGRFEWKLEGGALIIRVELPRARA
jgi:hypothetical protein